MASLGFSKRRSWTSQALIALSLSLSSAGLVACQGNQTNSKDSAESKSSKEEESTSEEEANSESDEETGAKTGESGENEEEDGPEENPKPEDEENTEEGSEEGSEGSKEPDDKSEEDPGTGAEKDESSTKPDSSDDSSDASSSTGSGETSSSPGSSSASTSSDGTSSEEPAEEPAPADEMQLFISVDWEGVELEEGNIRDFERFRRRFPKVPITQFLNAAYYTKPRARASSINRQVRRTLLDIDELGLHLHGWKMLFESAGVRYRSRPVFSGRVFVDKVGDAGLNVDIGAYTTPELRKVIAHSIKILEKNGFGRAKSFRAGGWMSRPSVREALTAEGIVRDTSDVATRFLVDELGFSAPLYRWLSRELWPNTTSSSQPYYMKTEHGPLLQIPDNGALADYVTGEEMLEVYKACLAYKRKNPEEHVTMSFGFHTESATRFLPRLARGLQLIYAQAKKDKIKVMARTSEQIKVSAKK